MFVVIQILSNTIKQGAQREKVWTENNVWSFLVANFFYFDIAGLDTHDIIMFCVVYVNF